MTHSRKPKRDLEPYRAAMEAAHIGEGPEPLCKDKPEDYADYGYPIPTARQAEELCIECPLYFICRQNAKHRNPAWGVVGGIAWVQGRQAHLLQRDDPRLRDPDLEVVGAPD